jgi:hypothetical protein
MSGVFQNIHPPLPHLPASVYRLWCGGGHTRWVERGRGVKILEDTRHCSVLYIGKYFVIVVKNQPFTSIRIRIRIQTLSCYHSKNKHFIFLFFTIFFKNSIFSILKRW